MFPERVSVAAQVMFFPQAGQMCLCCADALCVNEQSCAPLNVGADVWRWAWNVQVELLLGLLLLVVHGLARLAWLLSFRGQGWLSP